MVEDTLYLNTNLGTVVAVRKQDGQIRWLSCYPREKKGALESQNAHWFRDLNPCVYHQGILLVAPSDSDKIFGMDSATGQILWSNSFAQDVVHLLGVSAGNLIASGDQLWWIDVKSGKVKKSWPASSKSKPRGFGRGVLIGQKVYWPTRSKIWIFDARTTGKVDEPIDLTQLKVSGGNLLSINNYLIIAASAKLYVLSQHPVRKPKAGGDISMINFLLP